MSVAVTTVSRVRRLAARPVVFSMALALGAAAALAGGNPVGGPIPSKPAKQFPVTATLQMRPTTNPLKAFTGRVVQIVFLDTRSDRCATAVADVNALQDKYGPAGLTILWVASEEERPQVENWLTTNGVKSPAAIVDTRTREDVINREYPFPGMPWTFLVDAKGNVCWQCHPSDPALVNAMAPLLQQTTQAPVLPQGLIEMQPLLDAGTWMKARTALLAAVDGGKLAKPDAAWAKGVAKWIDMRRGKTIAEGDELEKQAWHWDAWWTFDDYTRRYEGAEGCDVARQKADAIREKAKSDEAMRLDLTNGDDVAKAQDWIAKGKPEPARNILQRISKLKTTRFADRAKELLETLPAKK